MIRPRIKSGDREIRNDYGLRGREVHDDLTEDKEISNDLTEDRDVSDDLTHYKEVSDDLTEDT